MNGGDFPTILSSFFPESSRISKVYPSSKNRNLGSEGVSLSLSSSFVCLCISATLVEVI